MNIKLEIVGHAFKPWRIRQSETTSPKEETKLVIEQKIPVKKVKSEECKPSFEVKNSSSIISKPQVEEPISEPVTEPLMPQPQDPPIRIPDPKPEPEEEEEDEQTKLINEFLMQHDESFLLDSFIHQHKTRWNNKREQSMATSLLKKEDILIQTVTEDSITNDSVVDSTMAESSPVPEIERYETKQELCDYEEKEEEEQKMDIDKTEQEHVNKQHTQQHDIQEEQDMSYADNEEDEVSSTHDIIEPQQKINDISTIKHTCPPISPLQWSSLLAKRTFIQEHSPRIKVPFIKDDEPVIEIIQDDDTEEEYVTEHISFDNNDDNDDNNDDNDDNDDDNDDDNIEDNIKHDKRDQSMYEAFLSLSQLTPQKHQNDNIQEKKYQQLKKEDTFIVEKENHLKEQKQQQQQYKKDVVSCNDDNNYIKQCENCKLVASEIFCRNCDMRLCSNSGNYCDIKIHTKFPTHQRWLLRSKEPIVIDDTSESRIDNNKEKEDIIVVEKNDIKLPIKVKEEIKTSENKNKINILPSEKSFRSTSIDLDSALRQLRRRICKIKGLSEEKSTSISDKSLLSFNRIQFRDTHLRKPIVVVVPSIVKETISKETTKEQMKDMKKRKDNNDILNINLLDNSNSIRKEESNEYIRKTKEENEYQNNNQNIVTSSSNEDVLRQECKNLLDFFD